LSYIIGCFILKKGKHMPYANNDSIRIYYEIEGSGPPLVLHHGYTSSLRAWHEDGYVAALKDRFRLILMDSRGHGKSDKPHDPSAYEPFLRAGDVAAVLDDLAIESAHFWGYSMGGRVGFALARYVPTRAKSLILGGMHAFERALPGWGHRDGAHRDGVLHDGHFDGSDKDAFLEALLTQWNARLSDLPQWKQDELLANDFMAMAACRRDEPSVEDVLPTMAMACLLYAGDQDRYYEGAKKCATIIPQATFVALPGLDHGSVFRRSHLILPHVLTFLEDVSLDAK
jgi:pimeloyl-ACP methyl ester carboxylesterase